MKRLFGAITLLLITSCASSGSRAPAGESAETIESAKQKITQLLTRYAEEDLKGSRAGFAGSTHWSNFVVEGEQPGWDMISVVKNFKVGEIKIGGDLKSATSDITYSQYGQLNADGKFTARVRDLVVPLSIINVKDEWKIHYLPEDVLPQVSKASAIANEQKALEAARKNKNKSEIDFHTKSLRALRKLK